MPSKNQERISFARRLVSRGDYREARKAARSALADPAAGEDEKKELNGILAMTGADPAAFAALGLTLAVLVFLAVHFVL